MVLNPLPQVLKKGMSVIGSVLRLIRCFFIMIGITMLELPLLLLTLGRETSIPELPPASSMKEEGAIGGKHFKLDVLEAADLAPETLRGYVKRSEPVMIKVRRRGGVGREGGREGGVVTGDGWRGVMQLRV